jgi:TatD DNase family protein
MPITDHGRLGASPPLPDPLPVGVADAHTHLDACGFTTPNAVVEAADRASSVGVTRIVTVADDLESARWVTLAAAADPRVFGAVALHPTRAAALGEAQRAELERLAGHPRVVAVGETGLDAYWPDRDPAAAPLPVQQEAFRWHIDLAKRLGKPLMIHDRDAHRLVLRTLAEEGAPERVIFHCFSGDVAMVRECADAGYLMSFAGTVTFRSAHGLREAAAQVPADLLLVETDAPFLTPHPYRGRPNEPYCVPYTLRELAAVRVQGTADLAAIVAANAARVFGLDAVPVGPPASGPPHGDDASRDDHGK